MGSAAYQPNTTLNMVEGVITTDTKYRGLSHFPSLICITAHTIELYKNKGEGAVTIGYT